MSDTTQWLRNFIDFVSEHNSVLLEKNLILPNQNGIFKKKTQLHIDNEIDEVLIIILDKLGEDWKEKLLHKDIYIKEGHSLSIIDITKEIDIEISKQDTPKNEVVFLLSNWIRENEKLAREHLPYTFKNKDILVTKTLGEEDREELHNILIKAKQGNGPSLKELNEIINTPSIEKYVAIASKHQNIGAALDLLQELEAKGQDITKIVKEYQKIQEFQEKQKVEIETEATLAIANRQALIKIKSFLDKTSEYDTSNWKQETNTIASGIIKDKKPIKIITKSVQKGYLYWNIKEQEIFESPENELWGYFGEKLIQEITLNQLFKNKERIPVSYQS